MKYKGKREDDVVATEWEKVDLSVAHRKEPEDEKKDEESSTETQKIKPESLGGKISLFLTKLKRSDGKATEEQRELEPEEKVDLSVAHRKEPEDEKKDEES